MKLLKSVLFASVMSCVAYPNIAAPVSVEENVGMASQQIATININSASAEMLTQLPGIGIGKAKAIVLFREENGAFLTVEDIKEVKGIGEKLFVKLESLVSVK